MVNVVDVVDVVDVVSLIRPKDHPYGMSETLFTPLARASTTFTQIDRCQSAGRCEETLTSVYIYNL